jgi:uncharacterized protein YjaG (DUF416 family)
MFRVHPGLVHHLVFIVVNSICNRYRPMLPNFHNFCQEKQAFANEMIEDFLLSPVNAPE